MDELDTRRSFLFTLGGVSASVWLAASWADIAAAAERATNPHALEFFNSDEAADVEAMTAQILPSGATPGAREAHALSFIDHSLATFFAVRAPAFRAGLAEFQRSFRNARPSIASFSSAPASEQVSFLTSVEQTEFFEAVRVLTIIGTLSSAKYGGNYAGAGWKIIGFEDQHAFSPPFGHYDRGYTGDDHEVS